MKKKPSKDKTSADRKKKPVSESYLFNAGGFYLQRYSSSISNFRTVLWRKARRRDWGDHTEEDIEGWIDAVTEKYTRMGALNDADYAENKVLSMRRAGKSRAWINKALRAKGVEQGLIDAALNTYRETTHEDDEWQAAIRFAQRRGFGPYTREKHRDDDQQISHQIRNRQLASFARAGFSFAQARAIIDTEDTTDLENFDRD